MVDFVADQQHRAANGLDSLAIHSRSGPTTATKSTVGAVFNGARRILRDALESGKAEDIGLSRAFIVALPSGGFRSGRRRPFPDDIARALASEENLLRLDALDSEDRGLRDIWETLVLTGRRCTEVLSVRLECVSRLNGLPLFLRCCTSRTPLAWVSWWRRVLRLQRPGPSPTCGRGCGRPGS